MKGKNGMTVSVKVVKEDLMGKENLNTSPAEFDYRHVLICLLTL